MTIKEARKQAGLTQAKMSELLEIPRRTIENWEAGVTVPPTYVEKFIVEKLKSLSQDNTYCVFYADWNDKINGKQMIFSGSLEECSAFEDEWRKNHCNGITSDCWVESLQEYNSKKSYADALKEYLSSLSADERNATFEKDGKTFNKAIYDFALNYNK